MINYKLDIYDLSFITDVNEQYKFIFMKIENDINNK